MRVRRDSGVYLRQWSECRFSLFDVFIWMYICKQMICRGQSGYLVSMYVQININTKEEMKKRQN